VRPNQVGYLYRNNRLKKRLEPGIYRFFDLKSELEVVTLPTTSKLIVITNQEVLTQDNIALRFSYLIEYRIFDSDRYVAKFDVFQSNPLFSGELLLHSLSQVHLREAIAQINSEELNEHRNEIFQSFSEVFSNQLTESGIEILQFLLRDITFPKQIQDLFARQLEAKIRAKADLENARTTVATARALKNAADMLKDSEDIKFYQLLETLTKISAKGNHTFVIGDLQQNGKSLNSR
jgi:regulator of protease activity HflC (stomatin/prohibitin superfamily)